MTSVYYQAQEEQVTGRQFAQFAKIIQFPKWKQSSYLPNATSFLSYRNQAIFRWLGSQFFWRNDLSDAIDQLYSQSLLAGTWMDGRVLHTFARVKLIH